MNTLFVLDRKDYNNKMPVKERWCVRALIQDSDGRILVQKSRDGEYKLPGGGVEAGEDRLETLIREVLEETGYRVKLPVKEEIGEVTERRADVYDPGCIYFNHTMFYKCEVGEDQTELNLTPEEIARGYTAVWEEIDKIIKINDDIQRDYWRRRDTLFLKWVMNNRI